MVIFAIDYGDARTGLAICDKNETMAFGRGCIKEINFKKVAQKVADTAKEAGAELIVVGDPLNMDGTEGPRSRKCRDMAKMITEISGIPTDMHDERLTTVTAYDLMHDTFTSAKKGKKNVDELSAVVILESYMELRRSGQ